MLERIRNNRSFSGKSPAGLYFLDRKVISFGEEIVLLYLSGSTYEEIAEKLFVLLQRKYPEITMKIVIAGTDEMFRLLNQNQVDFVYTLDPPHLPQ